jgi:hypothetical protein
LQIDDFKFKKNLNSINWIEVIIEIIQKKVINGTEYLVAKVKKL